MMPKDWFNRFIDSILKDPIRNIFILIISIIVIWVLGKTLYDSFGIITALGCLFACTYGITKIIDKPERAVIWAVGYIIGALILPIVLDSIAPIMNQRDWSSLISIFVIGFVILMLYLKARELKSY